VIELGMPNDLLVRISRTCHAAPTALQAQAHQSATCFTPTGIHFARSLSMSCGLPRNAPGLQLMRALFIKRTAMSQLRGLNGARAAYPDIRVIFRE
jgi:hypothetical protein